MRDIVLNENLPAPETELKKGSSGEDVLKIQKDLNTIARYFHLKKIPESGLFDQETDLAIRWFQRLFSLEADGLAGEQTKEKIDEILANFPGDDEYILLGGETIGPGSDPAAVKEIQNLLEKLREVYPDIPPQSGDGVYDEATKKAVQQFQVLFSLPPHGLVEGLTFRALKGAVTTGPKTPDLPFAGVNLSYGAQGSPVLKLQEYLNEIAEFYKVIPILAADGKFGLHTQNAVMMFQYLFDLRVDGVVNKTCWNRLVKMKNFLLWQ